ncbi:hypothetical protein HPB48_008672 [Haemaphysalis longicornis]|uniref:Uncharacterized protein n=1 Tax=Haemaphysalis longicornis TaxID=44386 RepID=A0A9J6FTX0_HAELO|nr:hypothetical protein HPB48_008672 [Haemaphysalis longicornis]
MIKKLTKQIQTFASQNKKLSTKEGTIGNKMDNSVKQLRLKVIIFGLGFAITRFLPQHVKGQNMTAHLAEDLDDNDVNISLYEQFKYPGKATTFDSEIPFRSFYDVDNQLGYTFDVIPDIIHLIRPLLRYEAVMNCNDDAIGSMMLFFHKNARFLRLYLQTYRYYNGSEWYYNAGGLPEIMVLRNHSHLAHCMTYGIECGLDMLSVLYAPHAYAYWRNAYAIHTLERYREEASYDPLPPSVEFNETNIRDLNNAFGEMSRSVLFGTSDFVPPDVPILSVAELTARKGRGEDLTYVSPQSANSKVFWLSPHK